MSTPLAGLAGDAGPAARERLERLGPLSLDLPGLVVAAPRAGITLGSGGYLVSGRVDGSRDVAAHLHAAGAAGLGELTGEYRVVAWDGAARRGWAAVDQLGARSLYWARVPGGVAFAADVRDLVALLASTPAPERTGVLAFLATGTILPGRSLLAGVQRLRGGELLRLGSGEPATERFWRPRYDGTLAGTEDELAQLTRERVLDAVERRLPPDGPAALMLSGGVDSAVVGGALRAVAGTRPLRTYSGVFPGHDEIDESALIERMRAFLGAQGTRSRVTGGRPLVGALEHIAHWLTPSTAPNVFLWTPLLERVRADGAGVVLDGEGGDEMFGIAPFWIADLLRRGRRSAAYDVAARFPGVPEDPAVHRRVVRHYARGAVPWRVRWAGRRLRPAARHVPPYVRGADARAVRAAVDDWAWTRRDGPRWWAQLVYLLTDLREAIDAHGFLHRRARQFGLQDAHPFLQDLGVVELALRLPPAVRFDPRYDRPLLRRAMRGLVPDELRLREGKSFFTALLEDGLRGPDRALLHELLGDPAARLGEYADLAAVRAVLLDGEPAAYPRGRLLWASDAWRAASVELWLRELEAPGAGARRLAEEGPAVEQELVGPDRDLPGTD